MLVGLAAAMFSIFMGIIVHHEFSIYHANLLIAASIATASFAGLILGSASATFARSQPDRSLMGLIVVYSPACNIDPDNVAVPIAASLGDLVTLSLLSFIGSGFYKVMHDQVMPNMNDPL